MPKNEKLSSLMRTLTDSDIKVIIRRKMSSKEELEVCRIIHGDDKRFERLTYKKGPINLNSMGG